MSGYVLTNTMAGSLQAIATTYKSLLRPVTGASNTKRLRIYELSFASVSVPNATDCQVQVDLTFCDGTTAGTGTAATPLPNDQGVAIGTPADVAIATAVVNYSAEPTVFTQADCWFNHGFNQRSGIMWQTVPEKGIQVPRTASVGPAMRALSTNYTGNVVARMGFDEL